MHGKNILEFLREFNIKSTKATYTTFMNNIGWYLRIGRRNRPNKNYFVINYSTNGTSLVIFMFLIWVITFLIGLSTEFCGCDAHLFQNSTTSKDFSEMKKYDAKQQNMGTIELVEDSDSSNEDIMVIREEKPCSNSTSNKGPPVAKVQPYEPPLNSEDSDDLIDTIMLDNDDQNDFVSAMTESDPFMGIESDNSTNNSVQDKQEVPSHPPAGPGFGLRLRSFAVDPTNNSFNAEANTLSNDSSTNASWHVTDEACPPDTTPNAEVSIYEVPSSNMRPAFPTPTVTYHHFLQLL